jgi:hypothetical protein
MKKLTLTFLTISLMLFIAICCLCSCGTLKETYKTENGITIHTIGTGSHAQAYLIVKQQKPTL